MQKSTGSSLCPQAYRVAVQLLFAGAQHRNPHPVFLPRGKIGKSIFPPAAAMRFPNAFVR